MTDLSPSQRRLLERARERAANARAALPSDRMSEDITRGAYALLKALLEAMPPPGHHPSTRPRPDEDKSAA